MTTERNGTIARAFTWLRTDRARAAGTMLLATALLANHRLLGALFAPDGSVDGERKIAAIVFVQVFCVLAGVSLVWARARRMMLRHAHSAPLAAMLIAIVSATIVLTGWGLRAYNSAHHHTAAAASQEPPTAAQREWADAFVRRCRESARRQGWFDFEKAKADGFEPQWKDREHYFKRDFLFDDNVLDPDRPEYLMYRDTPRGKLLMGFMFFGRTTEERGPQPGGALTPWHFHPWEPDGYCAENGILAVGRPDRQGRCAQGVRVRRSAEMLHVWFIDHPLGPYADAMVFPDSASTWNLTLLHPMTVHFTLGLFLVAVLLDIVGRTLSKPQLHAAAFINLVAAAFFAAATIAAGMAAEVRLLISHDVHAVLDTHKLLGFSAFGGIVLLLVWRLSYKGVFPTRYGVPYLLAGALTAALSTAAGYFGSELVYVHGVAVQAVDRSALERYQRTVFEQELGRTPTEPIVDHRMHGGH